MSARARPLTRRQLGQAALALGQSLLGAVSLAACRARVVEVERIVEVEREVTKIVRETVIVAPPSAGAPTAVTATPARAAITPLPSPRGRARVRIFALHYGWTRLGMRLTPSFEEILPNIAIEWQPHATWNTYAATVASQAAAGTTADLIEAPGGTLPALWAQAGLIRPLDELIAAEGLNTGDVFRAALAALAIGGVQWGMPFLAHPGNVLLAYSMPSLTEGNSTPPPETWSLAEMEDLAQRLVLRDGRRRTTRWALSLDSALPAAYPVLHGFRAHLLAADGRRCEANDAQGLACLTWLHALIHTLGVAPSPAEIEGGPTAMFLAGRLALLPTNLGTLAQVQRLRPDLDVRATFFPARHASARPGALAATMGYCINRRSAAPHEALQWAKYMSSREMGVQMLLGGYAEPGCRAAAWNDPRVLAVQPICGPLADVADLAEVERLPWNLRTAACLHAWNQELPALSAGRTEPDEAAQRICAAVDAVLAQPLATLGADGFVATP